MGPPPPELSPMDGGDPSELQQQHRSNTLPHRDCVQCTIERRASKQLQQQQQQQSPRVKMSSYYPPAPNSIDGSIKDYSLFEKNSLLDSNTGSSNNTVNTTFTPTTGTGKQAMSGITSSNKSLQSGRPHMYELPSGNNRFT